MRFAALAIQPLVGLNRQSLERYMEGGSYAGEGTSFSVRARNGHALAAARSAASCVRDLRLRPPTSKFISARAIRISRPVSKMERRLGA